MFIQFAGFQLHLYGLILGVAGVAGVLLGEKIVDHYESYKTWYWQMVVSIFVGGLFGARVYHVWTDWSLYSNHLDQILMVWNGGLSIVGAILGGCLAVVSVVLLKKRHVKKDSLFWLDLAALCLPISQSIGRLGNFVNQELYGQPTQLPWGIFIDRAHRVAGFEKYSYFHPLFAYEAIGMLLLVSVLGFLWQKKIWKLGDGRFVFAYLSFYGLFRGLLEFLRIEKTSFMSTSLGLNQVIVFVVGMASSVVLLILLKKTTLITVKQPAKLIVTLLMICGTSLVLSSCQPTLSSISTMTPPAADAESIPDRSTQLLRITSVEGMKSHELRVEVVNSAQSIEQGLSDRDQIGSDGMLFIFPFASKQSFWMPRMRFDLDILWIHKGKIVGISENVPHPSSPNQDLSTLPRYQSPSDADMVLEMPAGTSKLLQLQAGDALELI